MKFRVGTKRAVIRDAERTKDGDFVCAARGDVIPCVRDADGIPVRVNDVTGKPDADGMTAPAPRSFHFGHMPGHDWRSFKVMRRDQGLDRPTVIEMQNDPAIYRIETPAANMSHAHE